MILLAGHGRGAPARRSHGPRPDRDARLPPLPSAAELRLHVEQDAERGVQVDLGIRLQVDDPAELRRAFPMP